MKQAFSISIVAVCVAIHANALKLEVRNDNAFPLKAIAQTDARPVLNALGSAGCYVVYANGIEVPSQLTADSLLLFMVELPAGGTTVCNVRPAPAMHTYSKTVCGRIYPERADDVAWENESGGYRIYGPSTQKKGEKAFGYDIFCKYEGRPVVEELYASQCSGENWRKVDSLRKVDKTLAEAFEKTFTYHIDHGKGMDCYAVGPTLGAGVAAPLLDDGTISFPWSYSKARIIDNGPLRFTVELEFAPRTIGSDSAVVEKRIISLDAGGLLNHCKVSFTGMSGRNIAVGFPLRDESGTIAGEDGVVAYSDPTQGRENGRVYLGVVCPDGFDSVNETQGHILGVKHLDPDDTLDYYWGFVWDKNNPDISLSSWAETLRRFASAKPLSMTIIR